MQITGDLNVHVDVEEGHDSIKLYSILDRHSLQQHVRGPTHTGNHTLNLLISRADEDLVSRMAIESGSPSDHSILSCLYGQRMSPWSKCEAHKISLNKNH